MMMELTKLKHAFLAVLVMTTLAGCNSESTNDSNTDDGDSGGVGPSLSAGFAQIGIVLDEESPQQAQPVNMGVYVTVAEGDSAQLTRIDSLSEDGQCDTLVSIVSNSLLFDTHFVEGTACTYRYRVENGKADVAEDIVQVNASKSLSGDTPFYETVHQNISMDDGDVVFKLDELITSVPGFILDVSALLVSKNGEVSGDASNNEITFTPETDGVSEIYYAMSNAEDNRVISGVIHVDISVGENTAPTISDQGTVAQKNIHEAYTLDLADRISDVDSDSLQIIALETDSFASAKIGSSDPLTLEITGTLPGRSWIYFTVSDHNGGYAIGEIMADFTQPQRRGSMASNEF